ncbi:nucleotidyltransferase family protein [Methylohalobius crimeensis]|uniref:nucleotidyltransferase family protein n=1 Tax=Methylohalobius crimeensis TaxID=244365 RepID=UPI0006884898|nr:nucleotidyltransferase domain-containing protein [Methylohalobius crimeensis]
MTTIPASRSTSAEPRSSIDLHPEHRHIVDAILRRHIPQYEVWAFGSRVSGQAKPYSDLDLVVVGDRPLPLAVRAALSEAFSDSDLPFKIDIVDWATTSESFRRIIEREKQVIQRPQQ